MQGQGNANEMPPRQKEYVRVFFNFLIHTYWHYDWQPAASASLLQLPAAATASTKWRERGQQSTAKSNNQQSTSVWDLHQSVQLSKSQRIK